MLLLQQLFRAVRGWQVSSPSGVWCLLFATRSHTLLHPVLPTQDPFISAALGPNAKLERMRAAALRLGGQGLNATHDDHLLIIGDAAGHIDPLTGACGGSSSSRPTDTHARCVSCCVAVSVVALADCLQQGCCADVICAVLRCVLTRAGEGIHTAMMGGRACAETVLDMRTTGESSCCGCSDGWETSGVAKRHGSCLG